MAVNVLTEMVLKICCAR